MAKLRIALLTAALLGSLVACGSRAAEPPPRHASLGTPSQTGATQPAAPTMPEAAKAQSEAGAKAFVAYYTAVVDYTERTLDTALIASISSRTCTGCAGGIHAIEQIARAGGRISGGGETLTSVDSEPYLAGHSLSLEFTVTTSKERVIVPGKKTVLHPAGKNTMVITLLPRPTGWIVGELRPA